MNLRAFILTAVLASWSAALCAAPPKQELDEVRSRLQTLQTELRAAEESRAEAVDQLRASERAISDTNRKLRELGRQRTDLSQRLAQIEEETVRTRAEIERQQSEIGRMLHKQYMNGRAEPIRLVLAQQDPNRVARDLHYLTYVSRARGEAVTGLRRNLDQLAQLAADNQSRSEELGHVVKTQSEQKKALESEEKDRRKALASVSAELAKQRKEYATLKKDEERLTQLIEKIAKALTKSKAKPGGKKTLANRETPTPDAEGGDFPSLRGKLRLPVAGEVASRFGSPQGDGGFSRKGVFIRARQGQEVKAIATGRVVFADWLRGFGNLLIVDHGGGYMSLYGNNEALLRQPGDTVRAGDVVASVGASGGQEESGLYFEMRHQGKPFDPLQWAPPH